MSSSRMRSERGSPFPYDALARAVAGARTDWEVLAVPDASSPTMGFFHSVERRHATLLVVDSPRAVDVEDIRTVLEDERAARRGQTAVVLLGRSGFTDDAATWARRTAHSGGFRVYLISVGADGHPQHHVGKGSGAVDQQLVALVAAAVRERAPHPGATKSGERVAGRVEAPTHAATSAYAGVGAAVVAVHGQRTLPDRRHALIRSAKRSVWLSTYSYYDETVTAALTAARASSADVNVLLHVGNKEGVSKKNDAVARTLRAAGVTVFRVKTHAKCIVVDERHVLLGSQNCSQTGKFELSLEFDDPKFAAYLIGELRTAASADAGQRAARTPKQGARAPASRAKRTPRKPSAGAR